METDQPAPENPDKASSDEQGASPARSYDCTFCKRGFSNAQALGGHMNIHRRDKAKLKQASPTSEPSPDMMSKFIPSYSPNHPSSTTVKDKSSQHGKWPWVLQEDGEQHEYDDVSRRDKTKAHYTVGSEIRQLPLFDEKPSTTYQNPSDDIQVQDQGIEKGFSSNQELDLELRLGIEPQDSSPQRTTKKFF